MVNITQTSVNCTVKQINPSELEPLKGNITSKIGSGTFGECILKKYNRFGIIVLEKKLTSSSLKAVIHEAQCMNVMTHPSIPHLLGVQIEERPYSLVMQYIGNSNMESFTVHKLLSQSTTKQSPLSTIEWMSASSDITEAVQHIHNKDLLHCDIKTNNVLVVQKRGFVIDFGKACAVSKPSAKKYTSFYPHIAPEVLQGRPVSLSSDVFSLGVIFYNIGKTIENTTLYVLGKKCKSSVPSNRPNISDILMTLQPTPK